MREIKFRFWGDFGDFLEEENACEKEMVYGDIFCFFEPLPINDLFLDNSFQIMQFTGLKDKNGVDVYEGDIVFNDDRNSNGIVKFNNEYSCFITVYDGEEYQLWKSLSNLYYVIGNIHENPELL